MIGEKHGNKKWHNISCLHKIRDFFTLNVKRKHKIKWKINKISTKNEWKEKHN